MTTDLARALAACDQCIADACIEHDNDHLRRALAERHRLEQLLPEQRTDAQP